MNLLLLAALSIQTDFQFETQDHRIAMKVEYQAPYQGQPLAFYNSEDPTRRQCFTERCIEHFVGATALVNFTITKLHQKAPKPAKLREVVTIMEQGEDLPVTPKLDLAKPIIDGHISDLQLMGYNEDEFPAADRVRIRELSQHRMWRKVRQELYLNNSAEPFAVIEWKHTIKGIEIVGVVTKPQANSARSRKIAGSSVAAPYNGRNLPHPQFF